MMETIFQIIRPRYYRAIVYHILATVVRIAIPFILKEFLGEIEKDDKNNQRLLIYALSVTLLTFCAGVLTQHAIANTCGCKAMTGQIIRSVFTRKLCVSSNSFLKITNESLINKMILYELDHILSYIGELPKLWAVPINLVLNFYFIYIALNWRLLMVFAVFFVGVILLGIVKRKGISALRSYQAMEAKRATRIAEFIPKMKSVKVNSMSTFFKLKLSKIRSKASKLLIKMDIFDSIADSIFEGTPLFCSILIIGSLALFGSGLDISQAFAAISALEILSDPLDSLANSLDKMEAYSSAKESFRLFLEEVPEKENPEGNLEGNQSSIGINIQNCNFDFVTDEKMNSLLYKIIGRKYKKKENKFELKKSKHFEASAIVQGARLKIRQSQFELFSGNFRAKTLKNSDLRFKAFDAARAKKKNENDEKENLDKNMTKTLLKRISIKIVPGQKVCLVGKPGSGFSEFLLALMGEAKVSNPGGFQVNGSISYLNIRMDTFVDGTINDNITIGEDFDKERLKEGVDLLDIDFKNLRGEGYHQVLQGGKNLSLELQRKILLARWIYKKSDIYLVDDLFDDLNRVEWSLIHQELFLKELKDKIVIYMSYDNAQIKVKQTSNSSK